MKRFPKILLLLLTLISACSVRGEPAEMAPPADPENLPDLAETYLVNGFDPLGLEYSGHLTILPDTESGTYLLQWIIVGGIQKGRGMLKGNQLFVDWETIESSTEQTRGTAVYTITETGQLDGIRQVQGFDVEGSEQAYPNP